MEDFFGRLLGFVIMIAGGVITYYRRPIKDAIGDMDIGRPVGGTLNLVVLSGIFVFFFGLTWILTGKNLLQFIFESIFGNVA
jgi:hypothetical protein